MSIIGSTNFGGPLLAVAVDHDPTQVATDLCRGCLIFYVNKGIWYQKTADGPNTNVRKVGSPATWSVVDEVGGQSITGTPITLNLDHVSLQDPVFSVSGDEIIIHADGIFWISFHVSYDIKNTGGGEHGSVSAHVEEDQGCGAWQFIYDSYAQTYHNENSTGSGLGTSFPYKLCEGDRLRVRVKRLDGTTNIETAQYKSHFSIMQIE